MGIGRGYGLNAIAAAGFGILCAGWTVDATSKENCHVNILCITILGVPKLLVPYLESLGVEASNNCASTLSST